MRVILFVSLASLCLIQSTHGALRSPVRLAVLAAARRNVSTTAAMWQETPQSEWVYRLDLEGAWDLPQSSGCTTSRDSSDVACKVETISAADGPRAALAKGGVHDTTLKGV